MFKSVDGRRTTDAIGSLVSQGSWVRYPVWQHTFVPPSAFSRRAVVSYWRKYVHEVLVNRLGGLSLPRKSVVRLTDRPDMTLDVYRGRKTTMQQQQQQRTTDGGPSLYYKLTLRAFGSGELKIMYTAEKTQFYCMRRGTAVSMVPLLRAWRNTMGCMRCFPTELETDETLAYWLTAEKFASCINWY